MHWADPPGTLPKACHAGLVDMEWVIEDLTKSERSSKVGVSWCFAFERFRLPTAGRLQAFSSVPDGSVLASFCNVKVNKDDRGVGLTKNL